MEVDRLNNCNSFEELLSKNHGKVAAIRYALGERIKEYQNYNIDLKKGYILFDNLKFPIEFIGTESKITNSWMWGWNNINNFDDKIIDSVGKIKDYGLKNDIKVLTTPQFRIDENYNGDTLSSIVSGLCSDNSCYYKLPYGNDTIVYVMIKFENDDMSKSVSSEKFIEIVLSEIKKYELDHKIFIENFLLWNKTKFEWKSDLDLEIHFEKNIVIEFEKVIENNLDSGFRIKKIKIA